MCRATENIQSAATVICHSQNYPSRDKKKQTNKAETLLLALLQRQQTEHYTQMTRVLELLPNARGRGFYFCLADLHILTKLQKADIWDGIQS